MTPARAFRYSSCSRSLSGSGKARCGARPEDFYPLEAFPLHEIAEELPQARYLAPLVEAAELAEGWCELLAEAKPFWEPLAVAYEALP